MQARALQLHHLVRFVQGVEQREAGAGANVGAQAYIDLETLGLGQVEQAAAQKQVGGGAEGHGRAGFGQALAFVIAQVHAMGEYRAFAQQLEVVVYVEITLLLGEQRLDPIDLLEVFRQVRVHVHARVLLQQLAGQRQLFRRTGRGKARGDCIVQAALAVPALDQCLAFGIAGLGGVGQVVRSVAVHHHLAGNQAQVQALGFLEQSIDRFRVHAAEHQGGGGAVAQQFLEENLRHLVGVALVGELLFAREGVGVQPVQQLFAVGADHAGLREVDMGVDEPRGDQRVLVVLDRDIGIQGRQQFGGVANGTDTAIVDHQQAVLEVFMGSLQAHLGRVGDAVQDGGTVGFAGNGHNTLVKWLGCAGKAAATGQWGRHWRQHRAGRSRRCRWR